MAEKINMWGNIIMYCIENNYDLLQALEEVYFGNEFLKKYYNNGWHNDWQYGILKLAEKLNTSPKFFFNSYYQLKKIIYEYIGNYSLYFWDFELNEPREYKYVEENYNCYGNCDINNINFYAIKEWNNENQKYYYYLECSIFDITKLSFFEKNEMNIFKMNERHKFMISDSYISYGMVEIYGEYEGKLKDAIEDGIENSWNNKSFLTEYDFQDKWVQEKIDNIIRDTKKGLVYWGNGRSTYYEEGMPHHHEEYTLYCTKYRNYRGELVVFDNSNDYILYLETANPKNCRTSSSRLSVLRNFIVQSYSNMQELQNNSEIKKLLHTDIVVTTTHIACRDRDHRIEIYNGEIELMLLDNSKIVKQVFTGYCHECNIYFIYFSDYKKLLKEGTLLCKIIDYSEYYSNDNIEQVFHCKSQSALNIMGYNVQKNKSLTTEQRRTILLKSIEDGCVTLNDVVSFLDWLIRTHTPRENMHAAVQKWSEDLEFIKSYKEDMRENIRIDTIIIK